MSLLSPISWSVAHLQHLWMGRPEAAIFFGYGIGDDLLCTTVARELKKRGAGRLVMFSKHPELFEQNNDIAGVYDCGYATLGRRSRWGYRVIVPQYSIPSPDPDHEIFREEHLLATMCRMAGVTGPIDLCSYLTLLPHEQAAGQLRKKQIAIQSAGLGKMKNKDWIPGRYQEVVDQLAREFEFVQLGLLDDPPLRGVLDLRGKTSLRESAAILASSLVFIGQVGFLMHLGRAVNCRGVIVYGGREIPLVSGYGANENLVGPRPCSPCWQRNRCDFDHECMHMIESAEVVSAVHRQLARVGTPLVVEQVMVTSTPAKISVSPLVTKAAAAAKSG